MTHFVLDSTAVVAFSDACRSMGTNFSNIETKLTRLAIDGDLSCPPLSIKRCTSLAADELGSRWLITASGHFQMTEESYEYYERVLDDCEELVDPDDPEENAQVGVLALGLQLSDAGHDVAIVTEQWVDSPWKLSQGTAAGLLNLTAWKTSRFLSSI